MHNATALLQLGRLRKALAEATSPYARQVTADAIAAVGTNAAYQRLVEEVVNGGPADVECRKALAAVGSAATPLILRVLQTDPDCLGLVLALSPAPDIEVAQALVEVCGQTTSPWVVRYATEAIARSAPDLMPLLRTLLGRRSGPVLRAAFAVGQIAATPDEQHLPDLEKFLAAGLPPAVLALALTVEGGHHLPAARQAIERLLRSAVGRERAFAVRLIGLSR